VLDIRPKKSGLGEKWRHEIAAFSRPDRFIRQQTRQAFEDISIVRAALRSLSFAFPNT